jgi:hypothetical protein
MSDYNPRFTDAGLRTNPMYTTDNPFYPEFGMPNCTCYAWGRFWEVAGRQNLPNGPALSTGNGQDFWGHNDGYPRGQTPALGAIACYAGGDFSGLGHVCVVEAIDFDRQMCQVSESAFHGYFFRSTHEISYNGNYGYGGYTFQGFIYNPYAGTEPGPPIPGPGGSGRKLWMFKRTFYRGRTLNDVIR